jgi:N-acetylneuraminate synthase
VLRYPTPLEGAQLGLIEVLRGRFPEDLVGYSDHTVPDHGMEVLLAAWLLGADILEKHFTDDKTAPGNDHYHSMDQDDLARFRARVAAILPALRSSGERDLDMEAMARLHARRSLVTARPLPRGHRLEACDLIAKRPGTGISPMDAPRVVGRPVARALPEDSILKWNDLDKEKS